MRKRETDAATTDDEHRDQLAIRWLRRAIVRCSVDVSDLPDAQDRCRREGADLKALVRRLDRRGLRPVAMVPQVQEWLAAHKYPVFAESEPVEEEIVRRWTVESLWLH
jgi:hypothetical protein